MAGELVPVVLLPRFTTLVGPTTFETFPLDVRAYVMAELSLWRAPLLGAPFTTITFEMLESVDRVQWSSCPGPSHVDPGANTEAGFAWNLSKPWVRMRVNGLGAGFGVTCWVQGFFVKREK
jgi:hypothetical protein